MSLKIIKQQDITQCGVACLTMLCHYYGLKLPVPYTPSDFDIKSIDAFGAAYYDNKWLGVRFYGK